MSNLNQSIIGELQSKTLQEKVNTLNNWVDLSWRGYDHSSYEDPSSVEKYGIKAHINRVLLWLASKPLDYVRSDFKGGVLYSLLGKLNSDANLLEFKQDIQNRFNLEFSQDLTLLFLELKTDKSYKKLYINMIVKDAITDSVFPITTEASK